jgi:hypothetical protein
MRTFEEFFDNTQLTSELYINPKLAIAEFYLGKDSLPYTGLVAREEIKGDSLLFRIP